MLSNLVELLGQALVETSSRAIELLPQIVVAILIFALGWVIATVIAKAIAHVITLVKVDHALDKIGLTTLSQKAGVHLSLSGFLAGVVKWLIIIAFTITSAEILNLTQITKLLQDILMYIPQVVVAAIVLVMAVLVADFVAKIIAHSVKATGINAHFASSVARWSIIIVVGVFPALTQLKIAQGLVEVLFTGIVFALSLALGLSFGLGGRDTAAKVLEKLKD
jgi:hypothetical protein